MPLFIDYQSLDYGERFIAIKRNEYNIVYSSNQPRE